MVGYDDAPQGPGGPPGAQGHQAAGDRVLDVPGDVRPGALAGSSRRCATPPAGGTRAPIRVLPTGKIQAVIGTSPHGQGHDTTFVADHRRRPGRGHRGHRGAARRHRRWRRSGWTPTGAVRWPSAGSRCTGPADKVVDKARKIAAHELEVAEDDLDWADGRFSVKGAPDRGKGFGELAFSAWTAHDLPDGMEPGLEETAVYDPHELRVPLRLPHLRGGGRHRDRPGRDRQVRGARRRAAPSSTRRSWTGR